MTESEVKATWQEAVRLAAVVFRQAASKLPVDEVVAGALAERVLAVAEWERESTSEEALDVGA